MATIFTIEDFHLPHSASAVEVQIPHGIPITESQLVEFPAFVAWRDTLKTNLALQYTQEDHAFHDSPYTLRKIEIQSVDWFGRNIGFVKLKATIRNSNPKSEPLPGVAFLRGGSVAVLMILRPSDVLDERVVVMTEQPRVPAGSLAFFEIPAGMIDAEKNIKSKAATEIKEETGLTMQSSELIDLTELALRSSRAKEANLQHAMYPSPGGSDESIIIFLWEKILDRQEIEDLKDKLTGQRSRGEMITLRVCDYEELWQHGARDAKTLAAWALYEGLNRQGLIEAERLKIHANSLAKYTARDGHKAEGEGTT